MATIFISYSHKDETLRSELETHLAMLRNEGLVQLWHDHRILAGDDLDNAIDENLEKADVILLLVSPDFLASNYCYSIEAKRAMQRHHEKKARVIPVILRFCDGWQNAPFGKLRAAPKDGKPITRWEDRDEAFADVARQIRQALPKSTEEQPTSLPPANPATTDSPTPSDNFKIPKRYTQADQDSFLLMTFERIAGFFEGALRKLEEQNPDIQTRFRNIDADTFTAVIYLDGQKMAQCAIHCDSGHSATNGISFSSDESSRGNSFNEMLSVEIGEQGLGLKPLMNGLFGRPNAGSFLSREEAAKYYWAMLIERLQR